jgi:hypothetical protein
VTDVQPIHPPVRPRYMRTGRVLATACFVVLAAAACGSPSSGSAGAGSAGATLGTSASQPPSTTTAPTTTTTTPATPVPIVGQPPVNGTPSTVPVPPLPRTPVPPGQIDSGGMANPPEGVQVTDNGLDVVFNAEQSGCQVITAQTTAQTATRVTIQVVTTSTSNGNQMCPMIVRMVPVVAQLGNPLASRTILFQGVTKHS